MIGNVAGRKLFLERGKVLLMREEKAAFQLIRNYIQEHESEMMSLWEKLVNTESGSYQVDGVNRVARLIGDELKKAGLSVRYEQNEHAGDTMIAESTVDNGKAPMLFIGHMDTVFKEGAATKNPFRVDEEGKAHGPGVLDMKGGLVIAVYAIKACLAADFDARPIKCVFAPDEEIMHAKSNVKETLFNEAKGAVAAFNFETGFLDDTLVIGRKGGGPVSIKVHGVSAHSGNDPEKGRSAILEAAHKIAYLESKNDIPRGKLINCGTVTGGMGANTIPGECEIGIAIRYPNAAIREEIFEDLNAATEMTTVPDTWAELDTRNVVLNMETTDEVRALMKHIENTADEMGYGKVGSRVVGGLSDSGITVAAGVPTVCGMGVQGEGNHTEHEYAVAASLLTRCWLAACAVYNLRDDFAENAH